MLYLPEVGRLRKTFGKMKKLCPQLGYALALYHGGIIQPELATFFNPYER
jgi:hypothetical protein